MAVVDFDPQKVKKVNIEDVIPNTWNPKEKDTKEYKKVKESIFQKGLRGFVAVRTHPTEKSKYEIIDGQQRHTAATELGYEEIYVYDEGDVSDKEAKELTIWWQQQVPFEKVAEAYLVTQPVEAEGIDGVELPYTETEIEEFKQLANFSFDEYDQTRPNDDVESNAKTLKLLFGSEAYQIIMDAIHHVMVENDCSESRALELICADFLAGVKQSTTQEDK